jgi:hypothetical protein
MGEKIWGTFEPAGGPRGDLVVYLVGGHTTYFRLSERPQRELGIKPGERGTLIWTPRQWAVRPYSVSFPPGSPLVYRCGACGCAYSYGEFRCLSCGTTNRGEPLRWPEPVEAEDG